MKWNDIVESPHCFCLKCLAPMEVFYGPKCHECGNDSFTANTIPPGGVLYVTEGEVVP